MKKYGLEEQYKAYLEEYRKTLHKYDMDFLRPLTKAEYKNARESYISDRLSEGKKIYPSNINRDLVTKSKDYAMTPDQARAYKKGLEQMGLKIKYKTLRTNKAIKEQLDEDVKAYYDMRKGQEKGKQEGIDTKKIALEIGQYFYGSP